MSRFIIRKPKPTGKRRSPETSFQSRLVTELTWRLRPEVIMAAIPNGGFRHRRTAAILRSTGVKRGMTDLVFAYEEGQTAWLELKTGKVPLSDDQKGVAYRLKTMGHRHGVARTIDQALSTLAFWGLLKKGTQYRTPPEQPAESNDEFWQQRGFR